MYGDKMKMPEMPERPVSDADRYLLDVMAADLIRRAATLDRLCEDLEVAAIVLERRNQDLEMRENDLLKASLEMRKRKGAFSE